MVYGDCTSPSWPDCRLLWCTTLPQVTLGISPETMAFWCTPLPQVTLGISPETMDFLCTPMPQVTLGLCPGQFIPSPIELLTTQIQSPAISGSCHLSSSQR